MAAFNSHLSGLPQCRMCHVPCGPPPPGGLSGMEDAHADAGVAFSRRSNIEKRIRHAHVPWRAFHSDGKESLEKMIEPGMALDAVWRYGGGSNRARGNSPAMMASNLFADEPLTNERRRLLSPAARNCADLQEATAGDAQSGGGSERAISLIPQLLNTTTDHIALVGCCTSSTPTGHSAGSMYLSLLPTWLGGHQKKRQYIRPAGCPCPDGRPRGKKKRPPPNKLVGDPGPPMGHLYTVP